MTAETETPRGAPGRPEGSTLQPARPLLIQVRVTPGEKKRILDLARAQRGRKYVCLHAPLCAASAQ
jgi:hypothetical protein